MDERAAVTTHTQFAGRVVHGVGAIASLPDEVAALGRARPMLVSSPTVARGEIYGRAARALGDRTVAAFDRSVEHVPLDTVNELADQIRRCDADVLVAVGGGSALDTAKAAALAVAMSKPLDEAYEGSAGHRVCFDHGELPAIVTVPTTLSGAERTGAFSALHNDVKLNFAEEHCRAASVIQEPDALAATPRPVLAGSAMNSLAHSVEALQSPTCSPFGRIHHRLAIEKYVEFLPVAMATPEDVRANGELHLAAAFASGVSGARTGGPPGIAHALAHAVTGVTRVSHGAAYGVLLPIALRFNAPYAIDGGREIALAMTGGRSERAGDAVDELVRLRALGGLPSRLRSLGVPVESLPRIAEVAMLHFAIAINVRPISGAPEIAKLLEEAF